MEQENPGSISALHKCVFLFGYEVCGKWSGLNQRTRMEIKFNLVVLPGPVIGFKKLGPVQKLCQLSCDILSEDEKSPRLGVIFEFSIRF